MFYLFLTWSSLLCAAGLLHVILNIPHPLRAAAGAISRGKALFRSADRAGSWWSLGDDGALNERYLEAGGKMLERQFPGGGRGRPCLPAACQEFALLKPWTTMSCLAAPLPTVIGGLPP